MYVHAAVRASMQCVGQEGRQPYCTFLRWCWSPYVWIIEKYGNADSRTICKFSFDPSKIWSLFFIAFRDWRGWFDDDFIVSEIIFLMEHWSNSFARIIVSDMYSMRVGRMELPAVESVFTLVYRVEVWRKALQVFSMEWVRLADYQTKYWHYSSWDWASEDL